jgi:hypothetical protein
LILRRLIEFRTSITSCDLHCDTQLLREAMCCLPTCKGGRSVHYVPGNVAADVTMYL